MCKRMPILKNNNNNVYRPVNTKFLDGQIRYAKKKKGSIAFDVNNRIQTGNTNSAQVHNKRDIFPVQENLLGMPFTLPSNSRPLMEKRMEIKNSPSSFFLPFYESDLFLKKKTFLQLKEEGERTTRSSIRVYLVLTRNKTHTHTQIKNIVLSFGILYTQTQTERRRMNRLLPPPTSNLESNKSAKAVDLIFENEEGEEESPNFIPCINVFISYGLKRRMDADDYCVSKEEEEEEE